MTGQTPERFNKCFTQPSPLPEAARTAALAVLEHGRLHRYNRHPGEVTETTRLEEEFAAWMGARYCLAVTSGGYAMACVLRALAVNATTPVLTNAFTLAPVPGAIIAAGAKPVLVESTADLVIDCNDLKRKMAATGSRHLLLSHMRGHICDMERLMDICRSHDAVVIEDCAHTMGAAWRNVRSGTHGTAACFSTQTYKHMNSGEGGLITTDDAELMARLTMLSGSYMFHDQHSAGPDADCFRDVMLDTPNMSGRMDNLRAAILRPQLTTLDASCRAWTERYRILEAALEACPATTTIRRAAEEAFVGSSIQFRLPGCTEARARAMVVSCADRGVVLHWFGREEPVGYTSKFSSWRYCAGQDCPQTLAVLADLFDMRIPLTFTLEDCRLVAAIITDCAARCTRDAAAGPGGCRSGGTGTASSS